MREQVAPFWIVERSPHPEKGRRFVQVQRVETQADADALVAQWQRDTPASTVTAWKAPLWLLHHRADGAETPYD